MNNLQNDSEFHRRYWIAQGIFWGGYCAFNLIFMGLWGATSLFFVPLFIALSVLLACACHALRYLYKRFAQTWGLGFICLQLLWLLPLSALAVQSILYGGMFILLKIFPSVSAGVQPTSLGGLLSYAMNYCIMLILWCTLYLLRAEFHKRRNAEIIHWQLQARLKENELEFLRSQINSHFLFNAINNLRALINEDAEAARNGLADLSVLLRGLLHNNGQQLVTLREELEWVRGYLALEALQFENRLTTVIRVDDNLLFAKLPPLLIQTLAENAIKHGIAARRNGGTLQIIIAQSSPSKWQISVINPLPEFESTHQGNKIGLRNAKERLALAFGEEATLTLQFSDAVIATLELPL